MTKLVNMKHDGVGSFINRISIKNSRAAQQDADKGYPGRLTTKAVTTTTGAKSKDTDKVEYIDFLA